MKLKNSSEEQNFLIEQIDGIPVVKINISRATIKETKLFKQTLDSLLFVNHKKIIVDFSKCEFADSSIIGAVISVGKQLRNINGEICAVTPPGTINNFLAQTGLSRIISSYNNLEEALANF